MISFLFAFRFKKSVLVHIYVVPFCIVREILTLVNWILKSYTSKSIQ